MTLEETLAAALDNEARTLQEPGYPWVEHQRRVRRRFRRRAAAGATVLAGGGLLAVTALTTMAWGPPHGEAPTSRLAAGAAPSHAAQGPVLDGVELFYVPTGWATPAGSSPHSRDLRPGTVTRQDFSVGHDGEHGGAMIKVYRNAEVTVQAASQDVKVNDGSDMPSTTDGDASLGVVTFHSPDGSVAHRTGYRRLSPSVFVVVSSGGWSDETVRSVLAGAHLL